MYHPDAAPQGLSGTQYLEEETSAYDRLESIAQQGLTLHPVLFELDLAVVHAIWIEDEVLGNTLQ
jgi:hypothetical protein